MGRKDSRSVGGGEESGWTSYLEPKSYCNVSFLSEISSCADKTFTPKRHKDSIFGEAINCTFAALTTSCNCDSAAAASADDDDHVHRKTNGRTGNVEEVGIYVDYKGDDVGSEADEELKRPRYNYRKKKVMERTGSSSTLSDASNSFRVSKKPFRRSNPRSAHQISDPKPFRKSNQDVINQYKRKSHAGAGAAPRREVHLFEDIATSSPSSSALRATELADSSSSSSSSSSSFKMNVNNCDQIIRQDSFDELECTSDAVSTRFKVLEALIPRLAEVAPGQGKEEEMVKVIERHVRALELTVELLSSMWELSQLQHL